MAPKWSNILSKARRMRSRASRIIYWKFFSRASKRYFMFQLLNVAHLQNSFEKYVKEKIAQIIVDIKLAQVWCELLGRVAHILVREWWEQWSYDAISEGTDFLRGKWRTSNGNSRKYREGALLEIFSALTYRTFSTSCTASLLKWPNPLSNFDPFWMLNLRSSWLYALMYADAGVLEFC